VTGTVVGTALGLIAGYFGGMIDEVIMRVVDVWYGLPFVLVALVIAVILKPSLTTMMALLALFTWAGFVRNVRAEVLTLKTRDYVTIARVAGANATRIMLAHILPGVINTVLVLASLRAGQLILTEAFLSFLGAGIPPPTATWGSMIADGRSHLTNAWWVSVFPGIAIGLTVMSLNFMGDWMRDKLDPRLRQLT
jgi:peptide/nickel transport system permease protein